MLTIIMIWPSGISAQERFRRLPPPPKPLPFLRLADMESYTLANGLKITVMQKQALPLITVKLFIRSGENASPPDKEGLATLTARMLGKSIQSFSSADADEIMDSIGGRITIDVETDYSVFTFSSLQDHLESLLTMLNSMILDPVFSQKDLESIKRTLFYELLRRRKDPQVVGARILKRVIYEGHPFSRAAFNEQSIRSIEKKDVLQFFKENYISNSAQIIIIGDISISEATRRFSRSLNKWQPGPIKDIDPPQPSPLVHSKVCFVDFPDMKDAVIQVGNIIGPIENEDLYSLLVFNRVFGETPSSRLLMSLRESKGYAYFAFSSLDYYPRFAFFSLWAQVRSEVVFPSILYIKDELERTIKKRIPSEEVEQAKSSLIGNYALNMEHPAELASKIMEIQLYGYSRHWDAFYRNIMQVQPRSIFDLLRTSNFLTPAIVVIGDKDLLLDILIKEFNEVNIFDGSGTFQYSIKKSDDIE